MQRSQIIKDRQNSFPAFYSADSYFVQERIDPDDVDQSLTNTTINVQEMAQEWATANLQMTATDTAKFQTAYTDPSSGLHFCYMVKEANGLEIVNSGLQMTWTPTGQLLSHGQVWPETDNDVVLVKRHEGITCDQALQKIAISLQETETGWTSTESEGVTKFTNVPFTTGDVDCSEKLYQTKSGNLQHVYSLSVPTTHQYLNIFVDKASGMILGADDWTSHFSYTETGRLAKRHIPELRKRQAPPSNPTFRALQLGALDPQTVQPSIITDPVDYTASPRGWTDQSSVTSGNNVIATENGANQQNIRALVANGKKAQGQNFVFDFPADDTRQDPRQYQEASITNAYFHCNRLHDILYGYGFDERAGNFQKDNFGKGGVGGDPVIAIVQDGSGFNNANFATPPDGGSGVMRMFIFTSTTPRRDGAFENAVVLHELAHGVSNRLTGGPNAGNCLSQPVSGGLGEGWSDIIAICLEMEDIDTPATPKAVGQYVTGDALRGVRSFPYSTSLQLNPSLYSRGRRTIQVHQLGEIWASMLFEVYWYMVGTAGFDPTFKTNPQGGKGNNQFLKILLAGMKIQPCNPNFVTAKEAILTADQQLTNGRFQCEIIKGFAKRGLGINAKADFVNDFTIPSNCA